VDSRNDHGVGWRSGSRSHGGPGKRQRLTSRIVPTNAPNQKNHCDAHCAGDLVQPATADPLAAQPTGQPGQRSAAFAQAQGLLPGAKTATDTGQANLAALLSGLEVKQV
jgi:hypothetical protein